MSREHGDRGATHVALYVLSASILVTVFVLLGVHILTSAAQLLS